MADLGPAISGIAAFFVMLLLHIGALLAAVLAVGAYAALRMMWPAAPPPEPVEDPLVKARSAIDAMRRMTLTPPAVHAKLNAVVNAASRLLAFFEQDRANNIDGQIMVEQYLSLLSGVLVRYRDAARLAGGGGSQSVKSISELLDSLAERFDSLSEKLTHQEDTEISGEIKALNQALTEMDSLAIKLRGDNS